MDKTTLTYLNSVELNEMLSPLIEKRKWKQIRDILNTVSIDKDDIDTRCDTVIAMGEFINSEQLTGSKAYQASIYLTLSELAGLVNANDGMFINEKFLAYNSLSYKHNDFAKNFNSYPTKPLLAFDLEQILAKNKLSKNKKLKKNNLLILMNEYLTHYPKETNDGLLAQIFKDIDYLNAIVDSDIYGYDTSFPTRQREIYCSMFEKAVYLGSTEVVQHLMNKSNWNFDFIRKDSVNLAVAAITNPNISNKEQMLEIILNNIKEYDFNHLYYPDKDANRHYISVYNDKSVGYTLSEFVEKEKQDLINDPNYFSDYKEHFLKKYDKILSVIEKHQIEQGLNKNDTIGKNKQKI